MLGIGNCFQDSPCLLLTLELIATLLCPVLDDIPINFKLRISRFFLLEYFLEVGLVQELLKVVTINIPDQIRLRREIVLLRLPGEAGFEGTFNGIASKVVCPGELAVPQ